jgi:hypothetical protein
MKPRWTHLALHVRSLQASIASMPALGNRWTADTARSAQRVRLIDCERKN